MSSWPFPSLTTDAWVQTAASITRSQHVIVQRLKNRQEADTRNNAARAICARYNKAILKWGTSTELQPPHQHCGVGLRNGTSHFRILVMPRDSHCRFSGSHAGPWCGWMGLCSAITAAEGLVNFRSTSRESHTSGCGTREREREMALHP